MKKKWWLIAIKTFICLIIAPIFFIFLLAPLAWGIETKFKVFLDWNKNGSNSYLTLIKHMFDYPTNATYIVIGVSILLGIILLIALLKLSKSVKAKTSSKKDESVWTYNEFTTEGMSRASFVKKFKANNKPAFALAYLKDKKKYLLNPKNDVHAVVLGTSGSGKTEKVIIPNLYYNAALDYEDKPIFVITDPKKDILRRTGKHLEDNGYELIVFYLDNYKQSVKWNPLAKTYQLLQSNKDNLNTFVFAKFNEQVNELVDAFSWAESKQGETIWLSQGKSIVRLVIKFLLLYSLENEQLTLDYLNIGLVQSFLNVEAFKKSKWLKVIDENKNKNEAWAKLATIADAFKGTADETLSGFITNASNAISVFNEDENLAKITSGHQVDFKQLLTSNKPFAIFLCYPDEKDTAKSLISILVRDLYQQAIEYANTTKSQKLPRPLQYILEEFASLPRINNFSHWLAISRSRRIFFLTVLQDFEQLSKYDVGNKEDEVIKSQFALLYFLDTNNENTLKSISNSLGKKQIEKTSKSISNKSVSYSIHTNDEDVMSVAELRHKDPDMMIIMSAKTKPIALAPSGAWQYIKNDDYDINMIRNDDNDDITTNRFDTKTLKLVSYLQPNQQEEEEQEEKKLRKEKEFDIGNAPDGFSDTRLLRLSKKDEIVNSKIKRVAIKFNEQPLVNELLVWYMEKSPISDDASYFTEKVSINNKLDNQDNSYLYTELDLINDDSIVYCFSKVDDTNNILLYESINAVPNFPKQKRYRTISPRKNENDTNPDDTNKSTGFSEEKLDLMINNFYAKYKNQNNT
ncbi:type IV secretory system conjugative DNA transfer family protein [Ureaplasma diversum]|uniref:Uncharacterized protein n=1 Tax=Ureaplasma diversum NCTC 246 TaxID=1188241 RepID=A0A084EZ49_9BACT|nr:type IV secretory system conjugative DNA transfer family protein [Ureaplasma diversum]KEZ23241.1 hypothetical protein UDIV_3780 [Ureaplasma diversum NCTC 246]